MASDLFSQLNVGFIYTIFVSCILGISSFILAHKINPRFAFEHQHTTFYLTYLRYFWLYTGFAWFIQAVRLIFFLNGDDNLDKITFYLFIAFFSISILFFFLYLFSVLFKKYHFSSFIAFLSALIAGVFLFFSFVEGLYSGESSLWDSRWEISSLTQSLYIYGISGLSVFCMSVIFLREFFVRFFRKDDSFEPRHLYTVIGLFFYFLLFTLDFFGIYGGWHQILLRSLLLVPLYFIYYGYTAEPIHIRDGYRDKLSWYMRLFFSRPLLWKSILLIIGISIIPLVLASYIILHLFGVVFSGITSSARDVIFDHIYGQVIIMSIVIGVLTFFIGMSWVRGIVARLRLVYKGTQEISSGNFEYYIDEVGSHDEIRLLAFEFNRMSSYLQQYKEHVIQTSTTLNDRVIERTSQLENVSDELHELAERNSMVLDQLRAHSDLILENMADILIIFDENLGIVRCNKACLTYFNISADLFHEKGLSDIPDFQQSKILIEAINRILSKKNDSEIINFRINEHDMVCRVSSILLEDNRNGVMLLIHEVSPPWGTVRDSQTREPIKLAMVRLIDEKTQRVIDTEVTDPQGRFGFFVAQGHYYVTVLKDGYHFPPKDSVGYHGELLDIKSRDDGAIKFDIFMDPIITNTTQVVEAKFTKKASETFSIESMGELLTVQQLREQKNIHQ